MTLLRYLDVVVVAVATAPALALGVPALGFALGAGGWIVQRLVQLGDRTLLTRFQNPRALLTANLFEAFGRIWLLAAAIVIAAAAGTRADGLTAALVIFAAYSLAFVIRVLTGPDVRRLAP
jgi:hypothetical protein